MYYLSEIVTPKIGDVLVLKIHCNEHNSKIESTVRYTVTQIDTEKNRVGLQLKFQNFKVEPTFAELNFVLKNYLKFNEVKPKDEPIDNSIISTMPETLIVSQPLFGNSIQAV